MHRGNLKRNLHLNRRNVRRKGFLKDSLLAMRLNYRSSEKTKRKFVPLPTYSPLLCMISATFSAQTSLLRVVSDESHLALLDHTLTEVSLKDCASALLVRSVDLGHY